MRFLLDSQVLLWSMYHSSRLPSRTASTLAEQENSFFISDASLWEIAIKISKGRLEYVSELADFYQDVGSLELTRLPISLVHIQRSVGLPQIHGDPFDRILIAQAQLEKLTLVSVDADIQRYNVPVLW